MSAELSRRDFLIKGLGAAAAGLIFGEGDALAKKSATQPKETASDKGKQAEKSEQEIKVLPGGFLFDEIHRLIKDCEEPLKTKMKDELLRIQQKEQEHIFECRFKNSEQMERYFAPFLANSEKILKAVSAADPAVAVPREVILGVICMESRGNPEVKNEDSGVAGLYQFMGATARGFGLKVDGKTDERLNVERSSVAAVKYLLELYKDFGRQWGLALMAYSGGSTKLRQRIRDHFGSFKPDSFKEKNINAVTLYSKHFKGLGTQHSIQYPFGVELMGKLASELLKKKKYETAHSGK